MKELLQLKELIETKKKQNQLFRENEDNLVTDKHYFNGKIMAFDEILKLLEEVEG